ncbi:MAG: LysR family transcriptional regulator [Pseudomonadota bacterium]
MAEDYRGLAAFLAVADAGSFSAAARRMKLSTSVVSHHVSRLEAKMGTLLFYRSTRSMALTAEGQAILEPAQRMVAAAAEAFDLLSGTSDQPSGSLRITLPAFGVNTAIHQAVWTFARRHPMVALSLHSSDRPVDLVREGFDLGIRLGVLSDSSLISRRIGTFHRVLVASPEYLSQHGSIAGIDDLMALEFVSFDMLSDTITLRRGTEETSFVPRKIRLAVDSVTAAKAALLAGIGLQRLPLSEVEVELASGALVHVLPDWKPPELGVYAVWPGTGQKKKLTRRLIDALVEAGP